MKRKCSPNEGGCWFCNTIDDDRNDWLFSFEWDAYIHKGCLEEALEKDPFHFEAVTMAYNDFDMISKEEYDKRMDKIRAEWD